MADARFDEFFGVGGGSVGLFPVFPPKRGLEGFLDRYPEGFLGNGDTFTLPQAIGVAGDVIYKNNAGATVWTKVPTDINAAATNWLSFALDSVDGLLWVVAFAEATDTLYTATINAAGTVIVKGSAVTTTPLASASQGWGGSTSNRRGASMWRAVEGVGNWTITAANFVAVINFTTGAIVSEQANLVNFVAGAFPSSHGAYFSPGSTASLNDASNVAGVSQTLRVIKPMAFNAARFGVTDLRAPTSLGLPFNDNTNGTDRYVHLQWAGDVLIVTPLAAASGALFDRVEYLTAVDTLVENYRLD